MVYVCAEGRAWVEAGQAAAEAPGWGPAAHPPHTMRPGWVLLEWAGCGLPLACVPAYSAGEEGAAETNPRPRPLPSPERSGSRRRRRGGPSPRPSPRLARPPAAAATSRSPSPPSPLCSPTGGAAAAGSMARRGRGRPRRSGPRPRRSQAQQSGQLRRRLVPRAAAAAASGSSLGRRWRPGAVVFPGCMHAVLLVQRTHNGPGQASHVMLLQASSCVCYTDAQPCCM